MRNLAAAFLLIAAFSTANAQKFAYVDTEYILENIPEYKEAQGELDKLSIEWQKQLERRYSEIDKMYKNYQAEQILLTEDMKTKREEEIIKKEKEAKEKKQKEAKIWSGRRIIPKKTRIGKTYPG